MGIFILLAGIFLIFLPMFTDEGEEFEYDYSISYLMMAIGIVMTGIGCYWSGNDLAAVYPSVISSIAATCLTIFGWVIGGIGVIMLLLWADPVAIALMLVIGIIISIPVAIYKKLFGENSTEPA